MSQTGLFKRFLGWLWKAKSQEQSPEPLTTDQVLREEAEAIRHEAVPQEGIYRCLNGLGLKALCLSGGGIRSAAFALGLIQSLAAHPRREGGDPVKNPEGSLLGQFDYLSTVSGGGYIGSWLSAWLDRANFRTVWCNLIGRPAGPDNEPAPVDWLRSYSNYLTPQLGFLSADTWAIFAVYLRNLILNWLVLLPVLCAGILLLKFLIVLLTGFSFMNHTLSPRLCLVAVGILFLLVSLSYVTRNRPSRQDQPPEPGEVHGNADRAFFLGSLIWSLLSAIALTQYLGILDVGNASVKGYAQEPHAIRIFAAVGALSGLLIYAAGWLIGWPRKRDWPDFLLWSCSGLVYGALVGLGFYAYLLVPGDSPKAIIKIINSPVTYLIVGVPYILLAQWAADMVFIGLTSFQKQFNAEQEWLGRTGGWIMVTAACWNVLIFLIFAGFLAGVQGTDSLTFFVTYFVVPICAIWGAAIALVGTFSMTRYKFEPSSILSVLMNFSLSVAAPLFVSALIFSLSIGLDYLLLNRHLFGPEFRDMTGALMREHPGYGPWTQTLGRLLIGLVVSTVLAWIASRCININRFSLHALYRNRLIRAFLGASRERTPDPFTGLDSGDDRPMHQLWPKPDAKGAWPESVQEDWRPFHIVNLTLNIVSSKRLAWQERKAAPFTVSPLHCGTSVKSGGSMKEAGNLEERQGGAYRPSEKYGAPEGITLGTAMAISGAAANPNMGYHSSPSVALLMTMFNVRLGWWLGNPGREGDLTYTHEGPAIAIAPLIAETFGLTTDTRRYVHLSDGGHFENLGLYEMVRRRCRFIVISDAGRDPIYAFEDLGNAVRKISIDLGIPIKFYKLEALKRRPHDHSIIEQCDYHAIADIDYEEADANEDDDDEVAAGVADDDCNHDTSEDGQAKKRPKVKNGFILYVKAGYHGTESAGVRSYAMANLDFPHQSTANQWFSESQFESYRSLGFEIMESLMERAAQTKGSAYAAKPNLENLLVTLRDFACGSNNDPAVDHPEAVHPNHKTDDKAESVKRAGKAKQARGRTQEIKEPE